MNPESRRVAAIDVHKRVLMVVMTAKSRIPPSWLRGHLPTRQRGINNLGVIFESVPVNPVVGVIFESVPRPPPAAPPKS